MGLAYKKDIIDFREKQYKDNLTISMFVYILGLVVITIAGLFFIAKVATIYD